jgi:hypothetical protein
MRWTEAAMDQLPIEGVGKRLDNAIETLERLEESLQPAGLAEFEHIDVEFVGIYFHHLWQVTLGLLAVERITPAQRDAFRTIFGENIDVGEMRRLRSRGEFDLALTAFVDFIRWIIIFEGSLIAFDAQASRLQGMSLELVAVFKSVVSELFLVETDDISWRTHRFAAALEVLDEVLSTRWGDMRPF